MRQRFTAGAVLGVLALSTWPTAESPAGRVRLDGRAFVDDRGPQPALGTSLFWLAWGFRHDRERLDANLRWLSARGVDFVRAFAAVGGGDWHDRPVDPAWPDYVDVVRGATTMANTRGLRVQWTLFAGGTPEGDHLWRDATRRAIEALRPVVGGVQFIEIQNEGHGPPAALTRELAAQVRRELGVEVALTGTPHDGLPGLYRGSAATLATVHFDRSAGDDGWQFARKAWTYWDLADMPPAFVNNEPAGISASVRPEEDPVKLAADAIVTWIAGGAAYVLHHGAGVYGKAMLHPVGGPRVANVWEQPALERALALVAAARAWLPPDVANWTRVNHYWTAPLPTPPYRADHIGDEAVRVGRGAVRMYTARRGEHFVTVVIGIRDRVVLTPERTLRAEVVRPPFRQSASWTGGPLELREADGPVAIIIGRTQ